MTNSLEPKLLWSPQLGPQTALIECPVFEVCFGGARGGGKTEGSIGDWMEHLNTWKEHVNGAFFRRNRSDLVDVIARTKQLFPHIQGSYNENKSMWSWPNGARLSFEFLERDTDAQKYQGRSHTRIYIEEATQFPSPAPINKLKATLRSAAGVPCGLRLTCNPGGPGHVWVKGRYIDPAPGGFKIFTEREELEIDGKKILAELSRVFIPSSIRDNKLLLQNDPTYILRLRQVGSESLVRAWLEGDWNVVDGAFFDEWSPIHVIPGEIVDFIPKSAPRFRAFDWGSAKPFSVGWYAICDGEWVLPPEFPSFPRGALIKYREWYGKKDINVGLKMDAKLVAEGIVERERGEKILYGAADPSIFIRNGGPSIAELMAVKGCMWRPADNKRVPGWEQLHVRLKGEFGMPMLFFSEDCADSIRTIPLLQHSETHPEDVDTDGEDHAGDETRYACMSRPWLPSNVDITPQRVQHGRMTFMGAVQRLGALRRQKESSYG